MKKIFFAVSLLLPVAVLAQNAKIKIDIEREIGEIDPKIYGVFMEPIRNTLYGMLYDPSSPLADENGFKTNYIKAVRELKITNMRWPGGNYTAGYNWQDGIGPKDKRPVRKDLAWGVLDNNQVGTDEWVKLSRSLGTENVLCINLGTGTINDARYWVEYCNSEKGTSFADLRAKYGNEKPFNIKYWCLGNEVDGEPWIMGYKNAEDYCKIAKEAAKVMKYTDKNISFIANGSSYYESSGKCVDWNQKIITELRNVADFISIHRYWDYSDDYYVFMGQRAIDLEEKITIPVAQIAAVRTIYQLKKPIYLSIDEWASFNRGHLGTLALAQYFNAFIRHADVVKMANFTLLVSLLENDKEKGTFKTPLFYTFKLFSNNCLGTSLDVSVRCDTFSTNEFYKNIPYLDVTSVYSKETGSLIINVVNRHKDDAISTDILNVTGSFSGKATVSEVNNADIHAVYTFDKQEQYIPVSKQLDVKENSFTYSFPAHSFTQITVKIIK